MTPARLALLALAAVLAAACTVSEEEEAQLGAEYSEQIARELPLVDDPAIAGYVEALGQDIASRTSRAALPWQFRIVDASEVNAFAVPGGYIYVNRGLIERAQRMDELAGVLGHEIGHVVLRHSAEQMESRNRTSGVVTVFCLVTGLCDGGVAQVAINVAGAAWFARHSRHDEAEADSAGIAAVMAVGISPRGIPSFFETLLAERQREPTMLDDWFSSHPLEEERVAHVEALLSRIPEDSLAPLRRDDPGFPALKARLRQLPAATRQAPVAPGAPGARGEQGALPGP